jgi:hypothetical protein
MEGGYQNRIEKLDKCELYDLYRSTDVAIARSVAHVVSIGEMMCIEKFESYNLG